MYKSPDAVAKDLSANSTGGSLQLLSIEAEDGRVEASFSSDMTAHITTVVLEALPIIAHVGVVPGATCYDKMCQKKGLHWLHLLSQPLGCAFGAALARINTVGPVGGKVG